METPEEREERLEKRRVRDHERRAAQRSDDRQANFSYIYGVGASESA